MNIPSDGVVMKIVEDIQGRRGIGDELDMMDGATAAEMFTAWQEIVEAARAAERERVLAEVYRVSLFEVTPDYAPFEQIMDEARAAHKRQKGEPR